MSISQLTARRRSPSHVSVRTTWPLGRVRVRRDVANEARTGERADRGLGTLAATHPRGLTSNRHAGRPDRWSIRAFALRDSSPTTTVMVDGRQKERFDPRSPVQPGRSPAPYLLLAIVLAVAAWTVEQHWIADSGLPTMHSGKSREPASRMSAASEVSHGDVRTIFSADDYPADALAKGEQGTVQAELFVDADGRVSRCSILRSSSHRSLDDATCKILSQRARFTPARNADGKAVRSTVVTPPVRWQLEG